MFIFALISVFLMGWHCLLHSFYQAEVEFGRLQFAPANVTFAFQCSGAALSVVFPASCDAAISIAMGTTMNFML